MVLENIKAFYINLDFRIDRNRDVQEKLIGLGFKPENINRFSAIDGKELSAEIENKGLVDSQIIKLIKNKNVVCKSTELACMLSHYFLLKQVIQNPNISENEIIFIFEDDFFINQKYLEIKTFKQIIEDIEKFSIEQNNNWDMLFLGGRFTNGFIPKSINDMNILYLYSLRS